MKGRKTSERHKGLEQKSLQGLCGRQIRRAEVRSEDKRKAGGLTRTLILPTQYDL